MIARRALLLWALAACAPAAACAPTTRPAAAAPAAAPAAQPDEVSQASRTGWGPKDRTAARQAESIRKAPAAAVLRVLRVDDECSNAGGTHLTLEVVFQAKGAPMKTVAAGGHALWIDAKAGDLFVAGMGPPEEASRRENPGWCLKGLPAVDGYATTIIEEDSEDAARARLHDILQAK